MPWGTGFAEATRLFGARQRHDLPIARFPCREIGGFAVLDGELTAPGLDRPVLGATFELAPVREALWRPTYWSDVLSTVFGVPAELDRREVPPRADASGCVILSAHWRREDFGFGVSVYGALRDVQGGRSAGTLWLVWSEEKAAQPFLADWSSRSARLEGWATRLTKFDRFAVDEALYPMSSGDYYPVELPPEIAQRRARSLALHHPQILATPRAVASKLTTTSFALWASEADGVWCASTAWDSIAFPIGTPVAVSWAELRAAKGAGYAQLDIGRWGLRSGDRSPEIAAAVEWLRGMPGVTVERHEGYNA